MVLVSCWVLVSWLVQPLWDLTRDLRLHVETQTEKFQAFSHLLAQGPSIDREYQDLAVYLETEDDEQAHSSFLNELEQLSQASQLRMNLKPRPVKREERLSRFEVELDVEGSQQNLMTFLDALFGMPKLIAIERLRISSVPTKEDLLRANLVLQKVTFLQ